MSQFLLFGSWFSNVKLVQSKYKGPLSRHDIPLSPVRIEIIPLSLLLIRKTLKRDIPHFGSRRRQKERKLTSIRISPSLPNPSVRTVAYFKGSKRVVPIFVDSLFHSSWTQTQSLYKNFPFPYRFVETLVYFCTVKNLS